MMTALGDQPIEPHLREMLNALARGVDQILNGEDTPKWQRKNGFILMVFPFEGHEGRCNYISNAQRDDVVVLLREQLRRFEGAPDVTGTA
jgi:hypothetical protein